MDAAFQPNLFKIVIRSYNVSEECCKQINRYLKARRARIHSFTTTASCQIELLAYESKDSVFHELKFDRRSVNAQCKVNVGPNVIDRYGWFVE